MARLILIVFLMILTSCAGAEINWYITDPKDRSPFMIAAAILELATILYVVIRVAVNV